MILIFIFMIFNISKADLGKDYINQGIDKRSNLDSSKVYFEKALDYYNKNNYPQGESDALYYIGYSYEVRGDFKNAILYYKKAIEKINDLKFFRLKFRLNERLIISYRSLNLYLESNYYMKKNEDLLKYNIINDTLFNRHLYNKANYYYYIKDYHNVYNELNKIDTVYITNFKRQYYNLFAISCTYLKKFDLAEKYFQILLSNYYYNKMILSNIVLFYYKSNQPEKAEHFFRKLVQSAPLDKEVDEFVNKNLEAEIAYYQKSYLTAQSILQEALPYFIENKMYDRIIESLNLYLKIYLKTGNDEKVEYYTNEINKYNNIKLNKQVETSVRIIKELAELENTNNMISAENEQYKEFVIFISIFVFILVIVAYLFYKIWSIKNDIENKNIDILITYNIFYNVVVKEMNYVLSNFQKILITKLDFEKNMEIFKEFDEIVKLKNDLERIIKEQIEHPTAKLINSSDNFEENDDDEDDD